MADLYNLNNGLLTGLATGIRGGLDAFRSERDRKDRLRQQDIDNEYRRQLLASKIAGIDKDLEGKKELAVLKAGLLAGRDSAKKEGDNSITGKIIGAPEVEKVNMGSVAVASLDKLLDAINENSDLFGPIKGNIGSVNKYDKRAQILNSKIRATAQSAGKYLEGGVLRKEDEAKYAQMLSALSDLPDVAIGKNYNVRDLLLDKQRSDLEALKKSGYDTSGLESQVLKLAARPKLKKPQNNGLIQSAMASGKPKTVIQNGYTYTLNPETGEYE